MNELQKLQELEWNFTPTFEHQVVLSKDNVNIILNELSLKLFLGTKEHTTLEYTLEELKFVKLPTWENTLKHSFLKARISWLLKYVTKEDVKLFIKILDEKEKVKC